MANISPGREDLDPVISQCIGEIVERSSGEVVIDYYSADILLYEQIDQVAANEPGPTYDDELLASQIHSSPRNASCNGLQAFYNS